MSIQTPKELALLAVSQRKQLGLTQSEVASRVGLKQKTISAFENKPENTMLTTAFLILSALGLSIEVQSNDKISGKSAKWVHEW